MSSLFEFDPYYQKIESLVTLLLFIKSSGIKQNNNNKKEFKSIKIQKILYWSSNFEHFISTLDFTCFSSSLDWSVTFIQKCCDYLSVVRYGEHSPLSTPIKACLDLSWRITDIFRGWIASPTVCFISSASPRISFRMKR